MSQTLEMILKHWTDDEVFNEEYGHLDLPFDLEAFCLEMDKKIKELEGTNENLHLHSMRKN